MEKFCASHLLQSSIFTASEKRLLCFSSSDENVQTMTYFVLFYIKITDTPSFSAVL